MKAIEQYLPVAPFIMLYKVVLIFKSVDEILESVTIQMNFPVVLFTKLCGVTISSSAVLTNGKVNFVIFLTWK